MMKYYEQILFDETICLLLYLPVFFEKSRTSRRLLPGCLLQYIFLLFIIPTVRWLLIKFINIYYVLIIIIYYYREDDVMCVLMADGPYPYTGIQ